MYTLEFLVLPFYIWCITFISQTQEIIYIANLGSGGKLITKTIGRNEEGL